MTYDIQGPRPSGAAAGNQVGCSMVYQMAVHV